VKKKEKKKGEAQITRKFFGEDWGEKHQKGKKKEGKSRRVMWGDKNTKAPTE